MTTTPNTTLIRPDLPMMVHVTAPATLPAGYTFEAEINGDPTKLFNCEVVRIHAIIISFVDCGICLYSPPRKSSLTRILRNLLDIEQYEFCTAFSLAGRWGPRGPSVSFTSIEHV